MVEHYNEFKKWPTCEDGEVFRHPEEKWRNLNTSLIRGGRGLRTRGSSIAKLRPLAIKRVNKF